MHREIMATVRSCFSHREHGCPTPGLIRTAPKGKKYGHNLGAKGQINMIVIRITRDSLKERRFAEHQVISQEESTGDCGLPELAALIVAAVAIDEETNLSA